MFVRMLKQDSNRRAGTRTLLSLGLALAMSAVACGEDAAPAGQPSAARAEGDGNLGAVASDRGTAVRIAAPPRAAPLS